MTHRRHTKQPQKCHFFSYMSSMQASASQNINVPVEEPSFSPTLHSGVQVTVTAFV